jgi:TPP-dependent pyruvate/acetoin dehydrogenase alpha subunit
MRFIRLAVYNRSNSEETARMTTTTIGQSAAQLAGHQGFSIISNEKLLQLYLSMVKGRLLEERLGAHAGQSKSGPVAGQEAVAVGVLVDLLPEDAFVASPGDRMARLLWSEIQGKAMEKLWTPDARLDFATQLKLTLNTIQAKKATKTGKIAVVFLGSDSDLPEEAVKLAKTKRLPVLFVRQTSVLSETNPAQTGGIPTMPVDGTDVVAVYRVATESITHARKGNGPTLIECVLDPAEALDPIEKMEGYLVRKGLFRAAWKREEVARFMARLEATVDAAKA